MESAERLAVIKRKTDSQGNKLIRYQGDDFWQVEAK
jgi:hypothetical protein